MVKRGITAVQVCSTAFVTLGHAQAKALGCADLPIAIVPHPFGVLNRDQVRELAQRCVEDIARLAATTAAPKAAAGSAAGRRAATVEVADDWEAIDRLFRERRWTDELPIVPPTAERVARMLRSTSRAPDETIAAVAPGYGAATVERIAINAVMAGCEPACLPVLIAAVGAMAVPKFNLQSIQTTTNPAAVWLIVNGPIVKRLNMNAGMNCLGQGNRANATLGRALRLIQLNLGHALPGEMDRATHGQPGKFVFCCAENEQDSPWEPLHVERGYQPGQSTVTVVGAEGTLNMSTHTKDANELLRAIAETMMHPPSNEYTNGGEPWIVLGPEHAQVLHGAGLTKREIKRRLWEETRMPARRLTLMDLEHAQDVRRSELGILSPDTLLPIAPRPEEIGILVAGGAGTHSIYVPSFGMTRSITREVTEPA